MRYTVTKQRIEVLGTLWMPGVQAGTVFDLSAYDMANLGDPRDRDNVACWLATHAGDFSRVIDFRADFHDGDEHIVHDWSDPENEWAFHDCMYPAED